MKTLAFMILLLLATACGGPPIDDGIPFVPPGTQDEPPMDEQDPPVEDPPGDDPPEMMEEAPPPVREGWTLVWEDTFDGAAGTSPDASRWDYNIGGHGWGNAQLEHNTNRPTNVSTDGQGRLAITARQESFGGNAYTSARIVTMARFEQAYGRFEARIKLPRGQGIWPAFWMLGANFEEVGWPGCGEIDILEMRGQEPGKVQGSLHGPGYSGAHPIGGGFSLPGGGSFADGFHTFAVEWDPDRISWFVDDELYHVATPAQVPQGGTWVFDHPFFLILNVAVGGHYVGSPNPTTVFPQTMLVDHVRVFRRSP